LFTLTSLFLSALANWRKLSGTAGRYVFCGTSRQPTLRSASRTLSGTLLCGVRTFLPQFLTNRERPSGPAACGMIICEGYKRYRIEYVRALVSQHLVLLEAPASSMLR